jgi:hypothetical protein
MGMVWVLVMDLAMVLDMVTASAMVLDSVMELGLVMVLGFRLGMMKEKIQKQVEGWVTVQVTRLDIQLTR